MRAAKVAILTVCLLAGAGAVPVHAAGPNKREAEGRRHARKANQLADVNKCKAAIPEYTRAINLLRDPTLLFNRAECYRRTGESAKAVTDYRKFLFQLPSAPNRMQVQNQIAALERKKSTPAVAAAAPAVRPSIARPPMPRPVPAPPAPAPAAVAEERPPAQPVVPERDLAAPPVTQPPPPITRAPPPAPAPVEEPGPVALVDTRAPAVAQADSQAGSSHWWIWVVGAVVIVGAGAGTYFALKQGRTDIPPSTLGNYKF